MQETETDHPGKRRLRDLTETCKIPTGEEKVDQSCFFILDKNLHNTRGHRFKLYNSRSRLELRRNFFSQPVVQYWNKLLETVVNAMTVNTFKDKLDHCAGWGI